MNLQHIKAVLFDLDGTLIDSEYFYYSNWAPIFSAEFGLEISFSDWINEYAGHTLVRNVNYLKERHHIETTEEFMWKLTRANYAKADMRSISLMPFAKEILVFLKEKGIRVGLVTSSYQTTVDAVLGNHGLLDYFEFFVTRELVEHAKPNAEPYLLALDKLGLAKEEVMAVEDTITGATAARNAGLFCVAISKHPVEQNKLIGNADVLFDNLDELLVLLS